MNETILCYVSTRVSGKASLNSVDVYLKALRFYAKLYLGKVMEKRTALLRIRTCSRSVFEGEDKR
jgi:hypothetical protein